MSRSRQETLAGAIRATKPLFVRFTRDFTDHTRTRQFERLPNHVVWCLGHCALTMHRVAERFDGAPLPEADFKSGDGRSGDAKRFDTESVCFGSTAVDEPAIYPTLERAVEVYEAACDRFAAAVENATDARLDEELPWHDGSMTHEDLVLRLCFHNGCHAGQITDLRRAFEMPPVITPRR
ncbi:MAG: DinB family protein [Phycisphaerales bacterium]